MTPQASAFATPAHSPLSLPKKKNGRPPRLRGVARRVVRRARGASCRERAQRRGYSPAASGQRCALRRGLRAHLVADAMIDVATNTCHAVTGGSIAPSWSAEERERRVAEAGNQDCVVKRRAQPDAAQHARRAGRM